MIDGRRKNNLRIAIIKTCLNVRHPGRLLGFIALLLEERRFVVIHTVFIRYDLHVLESNVIDALFARSRRAAGRMRISVQARFQIFHDVIYLTVGVQRRTRVIQVTNPFENHNVSINAISCIFTMFRTHFDSL